MTVQTPRPRPPEAANTPYRLPPPIFDVRCRLCWFVAGLGVLAIASFATLDLQWTQFFSGAALASMGRFVGEFFPPDLSAPFLVKVAHATIETLAMSALGTLLAVVWGLLLALPASRTHENDRAWARAPPRCTGSTRPRAGPWCSPGQVRRPAPPRLAPRTRRCSRRACSSSSRCAIGSP